MGFLFYLFLALIVVGGGLLLRFFVIPVFCPACKWAQSWHAREAGYALIGLVCLIAGLMGLLGKFFSYLWSLL